jgi:protein-S-isoprenylcysteine O-methyltransferase Ste14
MHPWIAKSVVLAATIVLLVIRAPHGQRSRSVKVVRSAMGPLESLLLILAWIGFFVPLVWIAAPVFEFAEFAPHFERLIVGTLLYVVGLWVFWRSHADLGTNWSTTLQVREAHRLVTHGVYRSIRHPMYTALLLFSLGQAFVIPNWFAGPSYLVLMLLLVALRVVPEERLMRETFGAEYTDYAARTKRLLPGVW